ncbi:iron-sulfur cluster assembly accessory protein [Methylosinus sp. Sm6]|uniref:HesB/IscA family protein n=1 Tax=Methylosinus sp. Sm6 TaxID=2866948 RepID=UPI001C99DD7A|nr:iron-sulfur cluster assembly accessory protein [Methylosinus sp. Sm6]MBY6239998.1 iron-sulfur cluster assembly accessory protein [Methylosinus sp. Sm6]
MNIQFTPAAEKFIRRLVMFDGGPGYGLSLMVSPGGCSGMSAEFSVQPAPREGEQAFDFPSFKLFLPAQSRLLLDGVTIDFKETATSTGFSFIDPKAKACGCSSSTQTVVELPDITVA